MDHYLPKDITEFAKQEAAAFPIPNDPVKPCTAPSFHRIVKSDFNFKKNDRIKLKTQGRDSVLINKETIDLRYVEQLADSEQLSSLGILVKYAQLHIFDGKKTLSDAVEELCRMLDKKGLPAVCEGSYVPCGYAVPRKQEIFACLNRYRSLVI